MWKWIKKAVTPTKSKQKLKSNNTNDNISSLSNDSPKRESNDLSWLKHYNTSQLDMERLIYSIFNAYDAEMLPDLDMDLLMEDYTLQPNTLLILLAKRYSIDSERMVELIVG